MKNTLPTTTSPLQYKCIPAKNGEPTLQVTVSAGRTIFLHSQYNPNHEAQVRVAACGITADKDVVILGVGLGYELQAVLALLKEEQHVYVIEKSPELFTCFKEQGLYESVRKYPHVTFIIDAAPETIKEQIRERASSVCIVKNHAAMSVFSEYYAAAIAAIKPKRKKTMTALLLVGRGIAAPFIMQDVAIALKELNCAVHLLPLKPDTEACEKAARAVKPDFVLALDQNGLDFPWIKRLGCRRVAWFVDNPFYYIRNKVDKEILIFCWDEAYIPQLKSMGVPHAFFLPLATNPTTFKPLTVADADLEKFACDVSFVGSVGNMNPAQIYRRRKDRFGAYCNQEINQLLDKVVAQQMKRAFQGQIQRCHELLGDYAATIDNETLVAIDQHIDYELSDRLRAEVIGVLGGFRGRLFGDKNLAALSTSTCSYGGPLDYHTEAPKLYNACTININVTRPQLISTVNQRIYDIAATRSFFLTDYRQLLRAIIPFKPEMVCFNSARDLERKIHYYLEHNPERTELARLIFKNVITKHTYVVRMHELLTNIRRFL